jgi:hypothetical protein
MPSFTSANISTACRPASSLSKQQVTVSYFFRYGTARRKFKVNGRLHKGAVFIALNEGVDYYEIFLQDASGTRKVAEDIDFEQLGEVIDRHIERGENAAEYNAFCEAEYRKLMRGDFS